jgi:hypothetical protein
VRSSGIKQAGELFGVKIMCLSLEAMSAKKSTAALSSCVCKVRWKIMMTSQSVVIPQ